MRAGRAIQLGFAVLTVLAGGFGSAFWLLRDRGPSEAALARAAEFIRGAFQPSDLIVVVPSYATQISERIGDLTWVASDDPLREDFEFHPHIFLVAQFDRADRLVPEFLRRGFQLEGELAEKSLRVLKLRPPVRREVEYDFLASLRTAEVAHERKDGSLEPCDRYEARDFGRWVCRRDADWFYVAPEYQRMGDALRLCLWAHPPAEGRLLIRFPKVPLTGRLAGHAGHTRAGLLYGRAKVDLEVEVGERSQVFSFGRSEYWRPFVVLTATSGEAAVRFAVSSPDAASNHFCFSAQMRRP